MKALIVILLLCVTAHASMAQRIRIVEANGDSATYIRERPRTIVKHDTVTHITIERDTIYRVTALESREVMQPTLIQPIVIVERDSAQPLLATDAGSIGLFGYTDFRGSSIAPAMQVMLGTFHLWLYAGAYYTSVDHRATWTAGISGFAPIIHF